MTVEPNVPYQTDLQFTPEQMARIKSMLNDNKLKFFFVPSVYLRTLVAQESHPAVSLMADAIKRGILLGNTIALNNSVVVDFLEKTVVEPWKFMLAHGDVRVKQDGGFKINVQDNVKGRIS